MSNVLAVASGDHCSRSTVVALHCSGSSRRQWRQLTTELEDRFNVVAPDLFGAGSTGPWFGDRPFQLTDEAALTVDIIDSAEMPVHLVGHSYGGAVALRAAVERPNRVASLTLYEPTVFHILGSMGPDGRNILRGVQALAAQIDRAILVGAYRKAAELFVNYWNGPGAWAMMPVERQAQIGHYFPKASLDFRALFNETTPLTAYRRLRVPLLLMQGEHAPAPTEMIIRKLTSFMQPASAVTVAGAGHMGPISHAEAVAETIGNFIRSTEPTVEAVRPRHEVMRTAA